MILYLVMLNSDDESDSDYVRGVYSTLELARIAAKRFDGDVYETELDTEQHPAFVREEVKHWWDA